MSLNVDKSEPIGSDSARNNFKSEFLREGMGRDGIWIKDRENNLRKEEGHSFHLGRLESVREWVGMQLG